MVIFVLNWHLLRAEDIVSRFAYGGQSLSVPRPPGPGENLGNDEEQDEDEVPEQLVVDDDGENKVESKEPEKNQRSSRPTEDDLDVWKEYLLDDQTHLQQLEGGGGVVGVLQLELGPGVVEDGKEGEVTNVAPVASDDEQGADDVEEVEPGVEVEQLAAGAQGVASLDLSEWPSKQN